VPQQRPILQTDPELLIDSGITVRAWTNPVSMPWAGVGVDKLASID
jgi:hypothetical protein